MAFRLKGQPKSTPKKTQSFIAWPASLAVSVGRLLTLHKYFDQIVKLITGIMSVELTPAQGGRLWDRAIINQALPLGD